MKRILVFLLTLAVLVGVFPTLPSAAADSNIATGSCGALKWKLDSQGVLTVYGSGAMKDYSSSSSPWKTYAENITSIVIEAGATSIGSYAFYELEYVKTVSIPNTVISIGDYSFYGCESIETVEIPGSVTVIGKKAFSNCDMTSVKFSEGLKQIKEDAFSFCGMLSEVTLPDSLEIIEYYAFGQCHRLVSANLPKNILVLEKSVFSACTALETVTLGNNLQTISRSAFAHCYKLKNITIPGSVQYIDETAFAGCTELGTVKFTGAPPEMAYNVFNAAVATVKYPDTISAWESLRGSSFGGKLDYTSYSVAGHNYEDTVVPPTCTLRGYTRRTCTDAGCGEVYMDYYVDALGHAWDGGTVTGSKTTYTCTRCALTRYEYKASGSCGSGVRWSLDTETGILNITGKGGIVVPDGDDLPWGSYVSGIRHVKIEEGITSIGYQSFFECENIESIEIPSTVKSIGEGAFVWCSSLKELVIPEGVTEIKNTTFWGCSSLESLTLPSTLKKIGEEAFYSCRSLGTLVIPNGVTEIGELAFWQCTGLKEITVPPSVTVLSKDIFSSCSKLRTVNLPDTLTEIGEDAFSGCSSLSKINIPASVKSIGDTAFYGCSYLNAITIPGSVEYFGRGVFAGCESLYRISFVGAPPAFHEEAFKNTSSYVRYLDVNKDAWAECKTQKYGGDVKWEEYSLSSGHNYESTVIPPTCVYRGYTMHACTDKNCSYSYMDSYLQPLGHAWDEGTGNSTKWTYTCTRCSATRDVYTVSGVCGQGGSNLRWSLNTDEGVLTISGKGYMKSYSKNSAPWVKYKDSIRHVVIEDGVQSIGSYAFYEHGALESIDMPEKLYSLGLGSFAWCNKLKAIRIPEGVTVIPEDCFWACNEISELILPSTLKKISQDAFYSIRKLESIEIPAGVTSIGEYAFWTCTALKSITIPEGVTVLEKYCFASCSSLQSVTLPDGITEIKRGAFSGCKQLKSMNMPKKLTTIGINAFSNVAIPSVTFYANVKTIDDGAFYGAAVKELHFKGDLPKIDADAFNKVSATAYYPGGNATWTQEARKNYGGTLTWKSELPCAHDYNKDVTAPTCALDGYTIFDCLKCGYTYKGDVVPATGEHSFTDWYVDIEPTCQYEGYEYRNCTTCTEIEWHTLPMIEHKYEEINTFYPDCINGGWTEYQCTMCGDFYVTDYTDPTDDHYWYGEWEEVVSPTCTKAGEQTRWCYMCGYGESQSIPAKGHSYKSTVTQPDGENTGSITYTCSECGDSYAVKLYSSGDLNGDGAVNADDVLVCLELVFTSPTEAQLNTADLDGSGAVDIDDVLLCLDLCFETK